MTVTDGDRERARDALASYSIGTENNLNERIAQEIADERERAYEAGYRDGESSANADWAAALGEVLPSEVDAWNPGAVADYIRRAAGTTTTEGETNAR